ncbi:hypothetical protein D9756_010468 [Leucocoprinus leucothites]|uniref:Uncharacterized protein n=1 Tax=Leucocoprinus leucothites TaxID=201217 RepID=A0A8H5CUL5_9AGAR|nr:hypothetical protein D9756_010468 [Leucoagaricus leucothites]
MKVYGTIRRKRFMKQFWKTEAFVWICHIGIGVWSIIVYYRVIKDEKVQDCRDKIKEDSDDESVELCRDLLSFRGAPLPYIWATSIVETVIQTVALYFLWHWRALLNEYKIVDQEDVPNKSIGGGHVHMPKSEQQGLLGNSSESKFMLPAPVKSMSLGKKPIV